MFFGTAKTSEHNALQYNQDELDDRKRTPLWHLDKEKFLAFLGFCYVGGDERILPSESAR